MAEVETPNHSWGVPQPQLGCDNVRLTTSAFWVEGVTTSRHTPNPEGEDLSHATVPRTWRTVASMAEDAEDSRVRRHG